MRDDFMAAREWPSVEEFSRRFARKLVKLVNAETSAWGNATLESKGKWTGHERFELTIGAQAFVIHHFRLAAVGTSLIMERLVDALKQEGASALLPQFVGVIPEDGIVITRAPVGRMVGDGLSDKNLPEKCRSLGTWHRAFSATAPKKGVSRSWANYLSNSTRHAPGAFDAHHAFLSNVSVDEEVITNTNARLSNYICNDAGQVLLAQPTAFRYMPEGWGLLESGYALAKVFPDAITQIAENLAQGWWMGASSFGDFSGIDHEDLVQLVEIFCNAVPNLRYVGEGDLSAAYLEQFNANRAGRTPRVEAVFKTPCGETQMARPDKHYVEALHQRLVDIQNEPVDPEDAQAEPVAETQARRAESSEPPSVLLSALCKSCAGGCCRNGRKAQAYFKHSDLSAMRADNPQMAPETLADAIVAYVPDLHTKDACLFQGAQGCTLPRALRSQTCNSYLCSTAQKLISREKVLRDTGAPVLLVAQSGQRKRVSVWPDEVDQHERGTRPVP